MAGKWDEYFGTRFWRVATEVSGTDESGGAKIVFDKGRFGIWPHAGLTGVFQSPLSTNKGRRGVLLQEVDGEGRDIEGSVLPVGDRAFKRAQAEHKVLS